MKKYLKLIPAAAVLVLILLITYSSGKPSQTTANLPKPQTAPADTPTPEEISTNQPLSPTPTLLPPTLQPTATIDWQLTPDSRPPAVDWRDWPVIPGSLSLHAVQIYSAGLAQGRNPYHFSKVGDCQSTNGVFLSILETRPDYPLTQRIYQIFPEEAAAIAYFEGSWERESLAVADGMSVNTVLSPLWSDPEQCEPNETPLACEIRVWNPSIILISLGTVWQKGYGQVFDTQMRKIIEYAISQNVLPIMVTKADDVEDSDYLLNTIMAHIAQEEQIPLWNFWRAAQGLAHQGIDTEGYYNKNGETDNSRFIYLTADGWEMKTQTGLQTIHAVLTMLQAENAAPLSPIAPD